MDLDLPAPRQSDLSHLLDIGGQGLDFGPWVGQSPWRRVWQPTPVFLPGDSLGQRSRVGYSVTESDVTEHGMAWV